MKISRVKPMFIDRFLFVRIETDDGLHGLGESGAWGHLEASASAIEKFSEYLIGKDARRIEHHWNIMARAHHFTGAAITGAISALDIALWDLKGKALGVPVHELLGGAMRTHARLYAHVKGSTIEKQVEQSLRLKERVATLRGHQGDVLSAAFSLNGAKLVTTGEDKTARIWEVFDSVEELVTKCRGRLPRRLTAEQRDHFFLPED